LCECEAFLLESIPRINCKAFSFRKIGSYFKAHAKKAAADLRAHLGYSYSQVGRNVYDDFRSLGFHIFRRKLGNSNISGLYVKHPIAGKCILVNYSEDVYRQRFTTAHESAHAILDEEEGFVVSLLSEKGDWVETRANTFASCYLMPPEFISKIPDSSVWNTEKAIHWANQLRVSTEALAYALSAAKLISFSTKAQIKSVKVPSSMKSDPELPESLSPVSRQRREHFLEKGLSTFYVSLCFDAYERDVISAGRMAEMLLVDERELSDVAKIYGRTLKYGD
jgi:Zn-dependent peptidase ImmA (M78 family)